MTSMETWVGHHYLPKWTEVSITLMICAMGFFVFTLCVKYLPIFEDEHHGDPRRPNSGTGRVGRCAAAYAGALTQWAGAPANRAALPRFSREKPCSSSSGLRVKHVSTKLLVLLLACLACGSAVLGYINIRLHRHDLEQVSLEEAIGISDFVRDCTNRSMMANDREGLLESIQGIGNHSVIEHIRIINHDGRVAFSSDAHEAGTVIGRNSTQCVECHQESNKPAAQALPHLPGRRSGRHTPRAGCHRPHRQQTGVLQRGLPRASGHATHPRNSRHRPVPQARRRKPGAEQSVGHCAAAQRGRRRGSAGMDCDSHRAAYAAETVAAKEPNTWPKANSDTRSRWSRPTNWERWRSPSTA